MTGHPVKALRLAARRLRREWALRPPSTVFYVVGLPLAFALMQGLVIGGRVVLVGIWLMMYGLGWLAHKTWLLNGRVTMIVREWECTRDGCDYRLRVSHDPEARVEFARHLRKVHGVEVMPDDLGGIT